MLLLLVLPKADIVACFMLLSSYDSLFPLTSMRSSAFNVIIINAFGQSVIDHVSVNLDVVSIEEDSRHWNV